MKFSVIPNKHANGVANDRRKTKRVVKNGHATNELILSATLDGNDAIFPKILDYLLCLGICPNDIVFGIWRKGDVAEGRAGTLVRMAEGQSITFKITKKLSDMRRIQEMPSEIQRLVGPKLSN